VNPPIELTTIDYALYAEAYPNKMAENAFFLPVQFGWHDQPVDWESFCDPEDYPLEVSTKESFKQRARTLPASDLSRYPGRVLLDTVPFYEQVGRLSYAIKFSPIGINKTETEAFFAVWDIMVLAEGTRSGMGELNTCCIVARKTENNWNLVKKWHQMDGAARSPPHSYLDGHYLGEPERFYTPRFSAIKAEDLLKTYQILKSLF
jgi:hypothetical protein